MVDAAVLAEADLGHVVHHPPHAAPGGIPLEEIRQEAGVEVIGVGILHLVLGGSIAVAALDPALRARSSPAAFDIWMENPSQVRDHLSNRPLLPAAALLDCARSPAIRVISP